MSLLDCLEYKEDICKNKELFEDAKRAYHMSDVALAFYNSHRDCEFCDGLDRKCPAYELQDKYKVNDVAR